MTNIVPFGKYKDRPVEEMIADTNYIEWLQGQPWFAEKYTNIYNIIHSAGGEPEETPEHNALQAQFLYDDFIKKIFCTKIKRARIKITREFEHKNWDVYLRIKAYDIVCAEIVADPLALIDKEKLSLYKQNALKNLLEEGHHYGRLNRLGELVAAPIGPAKEKDTDYYDLYIEIKPEVGDDYPAILRQMKRNQLDHAIVELNRRRDLVDRLPAKLSGTFVLYTKKIATKYVTESDIIKIFDESSFRVLVDPT
jgi:hypothetical protein